MRFLRLFLFTLLLSLFTFLAGCGDEGSTTDSFNTTTVTIINTTTTTNVDGSKTITYTYSDGSVRTVTVPPPTAQ